MNAKTKIIALLDGSIYAQSVCDHAAWVSRRNGNPVELLHVLARRNEAGEPANLSGSIGLGARTALLEELADLDAKKARLAQTLGRAILQDANKRVAEAGVKDVTTKLRFGDFVETVHEFEKEADLIVIGKRGEKNNPDSLHLGSNLERVVRSSHKPVLVASRSFKPIGRFLVAFDGGPSAIKAVDHIAQSELFAGLDCLLLMAGSQRDESRRRLEDAATKLQILGSNVTTEILPGHAESVIASKVETGGINLLVMGAYGHSRIRNLIIGSTTTEMIRACKIPIMLFR